MKYGTLSLSRSINARRELVYEAWVKIEYRRHWFVGPAWTEIERSLELKENGHEIAHGRFEDGTESIYTARFHHVDPIVRLIYAFDMQVAEKHFSVSLAGVEFADSPTGTLMTSTEQAFYLDKDYGYEGRIEGTNGLLDQFTTYLDSMN